MRKLELYIKLVDIYKEIYATKGNIPEEIDYELGELIERLGNSLNQNDTHDMINYIRFGAVK